MNDAHAPIETFVVRAIVAITIVCIVFAISTVFVSMVYRQDIAEREVQFREVLTQVAQAQADQEIDIYRPEAGFAFRKPSPDWHHVPGSHHMVEMVHDRFGRVVIEPSAFAEDTTPHLENILDHVRQRTRLVRSVRQEPVIVGERKGLLAEWESYDGEETHRHQVVVVEGSPALVIDCSNRPGSYQSSRGEYDKLLKSIRFSLPLPQLPTRDPHANGTYRGGPGG